MKKIILTILTVLTLTQTQAFAIGAESGGGGNSVGTDPQAVSFFWLLMSNNVKYGEIDARLSGHSILEIEDPRAKVILQKIMELNEVKGILADTPRTVTNFGELFKEIFKFNNDNKFIKFLPTEKACRDPWGEPTDASYIRGSHNPIKICMSLPRLAKISGKSLAYEIAGIVLHELAHAAGYEGRKGEAAAKYVQVYYLNTFAEKCEFDIRTENGSDTNISSLDFVYDDYRWLKVSTTTKFMNNVQRNVENFPKNFEGKFLMQGESQLKFTYQDNDGSEKVGFVQMQAYQDDHNRLAHKILNSNVVIGGTKLNLKEVRIKNGCRLSDFNRAIGGVK